MGIARDASTTAKHPDPINTRAAKSLLPCFVQTEVCDAADPEQSKVITKHCTYYVRPKVAPVWRRRGGPEWEKYRYNLFPVICDARGVLWAEAVVYLLARLEDAVVPNMVTYAGIADDLAAYLQFLDDNAIDWTQFPGQKLLRPTYRFRGHLEQMVMADEIARTTAQRRMGSVIAFYRWLETDCRFVPSNPPWKDKDIYLRIESKLGRQHLKKVSTTDLAIPRRKQLDPYDGLIIDGGPLRPLPLHEQDWLVDALKTIDNPEMTLIHLIALRTGARIQTVLTIRQRHVLTKFNAQKVNVLLPAGPGTGIDTKDDKQMVLHLPVWLYEYLRIYAQSDRAKSRRLRAAGGDHNNQYLFLSQRGAPLYQGKLEALSFDSNNVLRYQRRGQGVRQFMSEKVIPFIQNKYSESFGYRFHDLRATAGMNWTDYQLQLVSEGKITLHQALEAVAAFLGHDSIEITERYINFRRNVAVVREVEEKYERRLEDLGEQAMVGLLYV
jgi:integrase